MHVPLPILINLSLSTLAFALPTDPTSAPNGLNDTLDQLSKDDAFTIPIDFNVAYTSGPGRKLAEWPFFDVFLTAVSTYATQLFNNRINEPRRFFDVDTKVRVSVAPTNGHTLLVKHAMWGLYDCALKISKGLAGAVAFKPAGCELQWGGQKIGFIRVSGGKGAPGDVPDPGDLGSMGNSTDSDPGLAGNDTEDSGDEGTIPQVNGTALSARDDGNALPVQDVTTAILTTGGAEIGRTSFVLSVFEALISLAAKPFPRPENPLITFGRQSAEGTRLDLKGEDVLFSVPSFYAIATSGLDQLVRALEKRHAWSETTFSLSYKKMKIYSGSMRRSIHSTVASS